LISFDFSLILDITYNRTHSFCSYSLPKIFAIIPIQLFTIPNIISHLFSLIFAFSKILKIFTYSLLFFAISFAPDAPPSQPPSFLRSIPIPTTFPTPYFEFNNICDQTGYHLDSASDPKPLPFSTWTTNNHISTIDSSTLLHHCYIDEMTEDSHYLSEEEMMRRPHPYIRKIHF